MKTLYFNRNTLMGEPQNFMSLAIQVDDDFSLTKDVQVLKEHKQKEDSEGNKIYLKDVYKEEVEEVLNYYDETLEVTEKPLMETVQKTNDSGDKLYLETIIDEETEEELDTFETTKAFDEKGNRNEPIMIEQQKVTANGKPIYLKPVMKEVVHKIFDHVEETTEQTDNPVLEPVYITEVKDVFKDLEHFSINDVLYAKLEGMVEDSDYDSICAGLFLSEDEIDLEKSFANTGVGILQLPPSGYVTTKSIELTGKAKSFTFINLDPLPEGISVYVNTKKVVDNKVELASPVGSIKIKFSNTTDKFIDIKSYCIIYKEEIVE